MLEQITYSKKKVQQYSLLMYGVYIDNICIYVLRTKICRTEHNQRNIDYITCLGLILHGPLW
jgi:hypothetical protein